MEPRRAFVVVCLCLLGALGVSFAVPSTLEEDYVGKHGWLPINLFGDVTIQQQHQNWHAREANFDSNVRGKEFLEFHREFLAQSDDFRIYGSDSPVPAAGDVDPDPVVTPVLAQSYLGQTAPLNSPARVKFGRSGSPCTRDSNHQIDDPPHGACNTNTAFWTERDGNLRLGTKKFHLYTTANELGANILPFHTNGHGAIGRHGPSDMIIPATSTKDPAFYQWHKNIDNIYADWAIGQYRMVGPENLLSFRGMPIFFSVAAGSQGSATVPNALYERSRGDAYLGVYPTPPPAEYGAKPRIGSDIYVARDRDKGTTPGTDYMNLVYATGTRVWGSSTTPPQAWDIDAWSILNSKSTQSSWQFSVSKDSAGLMNTAVVARTPGKKGGDLFESCALGTNVLLRSYDTLGLADTDELDALEYDRERRVQGTNDGQSDQIDDRPRQWFSLLSTTINNVQAFFHGRSLNPTPMTVGPGDILRFDENGDLVIDVRGVVDLDLAAGDDLDALVLVDVNGGNTLTSGDLVYYSLSAQSTSVQNGIFSAADVLCKTMGPTNPPNLPFAACPGLNGAVAVSANQLGLASNDDLDALDVRLDGGCLPPVGGPAPPPPTPVGACCGFSGQPCAEGKTESECTTAGGAWAGEDSVCATSLCPSAPGACCATNGNCTVVSDQACYDSAGTFRGPGTTCQPTPACPVAPANDECVNATVIPYNFVSGFQPPANNTTATRPHYSLPQDPPYSCMDHNVFADARGSGTLWYSYTVPVIAGSAPGPGPDMIPGPGPRRSILITTDQAALHYPGGGGAGDTRLALFYAPNGNCSVLQEVACADNITGDGTNLAPYAPLRYDRPVPGRYYLLVSTVYNVDRGNTYLTVSDPPTPATSSIPTFSTWGRLVLTLVLIGSGASFLLRRRRPAV